MLYTNNYSNIVRLLAGKESKTLSGVEHTSIIVSVNFNFYTQYLIFLQILFLSKGFQDISGTLILYKSTFKATLLGVMSLKILIPNIVIKV